MNASRSPAVLFDIDGTLVDSNYLHVHAWARAFYDVGIAVDAWRIHRSIGMDGSTLVKILSGGADNDVRERLKDLHSRYYKELTPMLRVLPGGRDVLERVASMGLQVVLATSAPDDELSVLRGGAWIATAWCRRRRRQPTSTRPSPSPTSSTSRSTAPA